MFDLSAALAAHNAAAGADTEMPDFDDEWLGMSHFDERWPTGA